MIIAIGNDHTSVELKENVKEFLTDLGHEVLDVGTNSSERADYPVFGRAVAELVIAGNAERGIAICGSGVGISIAANKVPGIRAVVCSEPYSAKLSRLHNDTNVLAFGSRVVGTDLARMIVGEWINADYEGGRHQRRINQISATEKSLPIENLVDPEGSDS